MDGEVEVWCSKRWVAIWYLAALLWVLVAFMHFFMYNWTVFRYVIIVLDVLLIVLAFVNGYRSQTRPQFILSSRGITIYRPFWRTLIPSEAIRSVMMVDANTYVVNYWKKSKQKRASFSLMWLPGKTRDEVVKWLRSHPKFSEKEAFWIKSKRFEKYWKALRKSRLADYAKMLHSPVQAFRDSVKETLGAVIGRFALLLVANTVMSFAAYTLFCSSCMLCSSLAFIQVEGEDSSGISLVTGFAELSLLSLTSALLLLIFGSAWLHLLVLLYGGKGGYPATLRVVALSAMPMLLLSWIPFIGNYAALWTLILVVVGVRELHGLGWGRSALVLLMAMLVPLTLAVMLIILG